jgi:hypothetical protein
MSARHGLPFAEFVPDNVGGARGRLNICSNADTSALALSPVRAR